MGPVSGNRRCGVTIVDRQRAVAVAKRSLSYDPLFKPRRFRGPGVLRLELVVGALHTRAHSDRDAWDVLNEICLDLVRSGNRIPQPLHGWVAERLEGRGTRPVSTDEKKKGGRPRNIIRDRQLARAVDVVVDKFGVAETPSERKPGSPGWSAAEAVAGAAGLGRELVVQSVKRRRKRLKQGPWPIQDVLDELEEKAAVIERHERLGLRRGSRGGMWNNDWSLRAELHPDGGPGLIREMQEWWAEMEAKGWRRPESRYRILGPLFFD